MMESIAETEIEIEKLQKEINEIIEWLKENRPARSYLVYRQKVQELSQKTQQITKLRASRDWMIKRGSI